MIKTNRFRLLCCNKDGGEESRVWAYWLFMWKALCSVALLKFENGTRDAYHKHAFNALSWVIKGQLTERHVNGATVVYGPSWRPIYTPRETFHQVESHGRTWVLTLRGPWCDTWQERTSAGVRTLTHGRVVVYEH